MAYFDGIRPGDEVYHLTQGTLTFLRKLDAYDLEFKNKKDVYICTDMDGCNQFGQQIVFWQKPEIIDKGKPLPDLKVDAKVIVWHDEQGIWKRHFSNFSSDGKICVFRQGMTSFTSDGAVDSFDRYEIVEE